MPAQASMYFPGKLVRWDVLRLSNRHRARQRDPRPAHGPQCASVLPAADPGKPVHLDPLHDRNSVQIALSTVINALATNTLDTRRASALLYGIQLAASHLQPLPSLRDTGLSAPSEN
jgi:hypothetical protein